ncbi:unnamed protein product [Pseudo-nitzschia multistriata]|uniref:Uncharacterized protein n=1 Tax=Pseudo-nitzschia multistriata TaxID=183589 RepID=A0A448ZHV7_9STRA|nr:unnamed protein product [Pseudo-nitzschia multistriata]
MSWLWGTKKDDSMEEDLADEGIQSEEEIHTDSSDESEPEDHSVDGKVTTEETVDDYDGESSDESAYDNSSDEDDEGDYDEDDDEDDDSLVVNLIESMTSDDDTVDENLEEADLLTSDDEEDDETVARVEGGTQENRKTDKVDENETSHPPVDDTDDDDDDGDDDDDDKNGDPVTSFWEKQSLLVLAAEHDRVDILKKLLKEENEEKDSLLNTGIPPLHLAITFGSVNTAQSLLRMGSDPSVRPNVDVVLEERRSQPKDSKVDIANIRRFDNVTAWELAFGNALYDEKSMSNKSSGSWSMFGSTMSGESEGMNEAAPTAKSTNGAQTIVKPVDMAPSKREGIRHAFTAEALRSVGGDEAHRLKQLLDSGMPSDIDIGGKDLYGWAVDMGSLKCEELLRPDESPDQDGGSTNASPGGDDAPSDLSSSFVVHRPDVQETIPQLKNRLDELESLSSALSTCLDNLAEEVSVCHGLLLMGGGASALASHVRSLRDLKEQKLYEMENARLECQDAERELADLVHSSGDIGKEIDHIANFNFLNYGVEKNAGVHTSHIKLQQNENDSDGDGDGAIDDPSINKEAEAEAEKLNIKAQIAAIENKIRKLRASITDLSEENTRDLAEVQRRGLEGGINLVRGLREELRDFDFYLSEARSMKAVCKSKISMIIAHVSKKNINNTEGSLDKVPVARRGTTNHSVGYDVRNDATIANDATIGSKSMDYSTDEDDDEIEEAVLVESPSKIDALQKEESSKETAFDSPKMQTPIQVSEEKRSQESTVNNVDSSTVDGKSASQRISSGESREITVIHPGNKGLFTVDLWEVILRIIGFESAANRRSLENKAHHGSSTTVMII